MSRDASAANQPPIPNNMGGLKPHEQKTRGKTDLSRYWCGIDQLTLNYMVAWGARWETEHKEQCVDNLREKLDTYQLEAMAKNEPIEMPEFAGVKMHPLGGRIGTKRCRFKLEMESCILLIADQPKYRGDWPNVKIEICGERCLCYSGGASAAYRDAVRFLVSLGGEIHKERVNRVDVCADLPEWGMGAFMRKAAAKHWNCRSRYHVPYDVPTGRSLYWGQSAIILRIYDKLKEQQMKSLRGAPARYLRMIKQRWGGEEPSKAVRVEFQVRRDALKTFGITDYDSWAENCMDVLRYLTGVGVTFDKWSKKEGKYIRQENARWFRIFKKAPNKAHPEYNQVWKRWEIVQRVFLENFGEAEPLCEIRPEEADLTTMFKQVYGVIKAAACNHGYKIEGKKSAAEEKYKFGSYESFEHWFCMNIREIAREKGEWDLRNEPEYTELDYYLDEEIPADVLNLIRMEEENCGRQMSLLNA